MASGHATSEADKLAQANATIKELEAKSLPRRIGSEQRNLLLSFFSPEMGSGNKINMSYSSDTEEYNFGKDVEEFLRAAGFSVTDSVGNTVITPYPQTGTSILVNPKSRVIAFAALQSALNPEHQV